MYVPPAAETGRNVSLGYKRDLLGDAVAEAKCSGRGASRSPVSETVAGDPTAAADRIAAHPMPAVAAALGDWRVIRGVVDGGDGGRSCRMYRQPRGADHAGKSHYRDSHRFRSWCDGAFGGGPGLRRTVIMTTAGFQLLTRRGPPRFINTVGGNLLLSGRDRALQCCRGDLPMVYRAATTQIDGDDRTQPAIRPRFCRSL